MHRPLHIGPLDQVEPKRSLLTRVAIGGMVGGGAIILAPHVLPALGMGSEAMAQEASFVLHTSADAGGSGLAGAINSLLAEVPLIGESLAEGGLVNALATGVIGIGGVLLGRSMRHHEHGDGIPWGKVVQYAALATSALIALPTVLTALGTGLIYLSTLAGSTEFTNDVISGVDKTLGTMSGNAHSMMGFSGLAAVIPHFLTCGVAMVPAAMAMSLPDPRGNFAERVHTPYTGEPQKYSDGSIRMEMKINAPTSQDVPADVLLRLTHSDTGMPLTMEELATVHTQKMHLLVVDQGLKDYQHIHPQPTDEPGVFAFSFTPKTNNAYGAWADITINGRNHKLHTDFPAAHPRPVKPASRANTEAQAKDMSFVWEGEPLEQSKGSIVNVHVLDAAGPVKNLQPVMGAYAHLVGFSADGQSVVHSHPLGPEPTSADEHGGPSLRFHVEPDAAGPVQFYLQVRRNNEDVFVPFGQQVKQPLLAAARPQTAAAWPASRGA